MKTESERFKVVLFNSVGYPPPNIQVYSFFYNIPTKKTRNIKDHSEVWSRTIKDSHTRRHQNRFPIVNDTLRHILILLHYRVKSVNIPWSFNIQSIKVNTISDAKKKTIRGIFIPQCNRKGAQRTFCHRALCPIDIINK